MFCMESTFAGIVPMSLAKIDKERIIDVKGMNYTLINNCDVSTDSRSHIWQMPKMGVVRKITIKINCWFIFDVEIAIPATLSTP